MSTLKHSFFNQLPNNFNNVSFKDYNFDIKEFENEFYSLYQLFNSNKKRWIKEKEIVSYMYYMCNLTLLYYQYDYVCNDLSNLIAKRKEIECYIREHFKLDDQKYIKKNSGQIKSNIRPHHPFFISITKIRQFISILNANRSYWGYSRALANHAILYFQTHSFASYFLIYDIATEQYISQEILNLLNKSREPLVIIGITLYTLRVTINLILIIKHMVEAAQNEQLSTKNVLIHEIEKRGFSMLSDLVWAIVTLLTNYNVFFQIAQATIAPIIITFLGFDALLFLVELTMEYVKYNQLLMKLTTQQDETLSIKEQILIQRQIDYLQDEWQVKSAGFFVNILAANLIIIGFGMSLLCTGPFILAGLSFLCSFGNALYNTIDKFKIYQKSNVAIQREKSNGKILNDDYHQKSLIYLEQECLQANIDFWNTLFLTTTGMSCIIAAAVISWPIALSLTIGYIIYKIHAITNENVANSKHIDKDVPDIYRFFNMKQIKSIEISPPVLNSIYLSSYQFD